MNAAVLLIGAAILLVGSIWVTVVAFRTSILWGIGSLLLAPVQLIFVITHWQESKTPFFISIAGLLMASLALKQMPATTPQQQVSTVPATTTHASFESVMKSVPQAEPVRSAPAPAPQPVAAATESISQPMIERVWADNSTKLYYDTNCKSHPDNAYLISKSLATRQGYKAASCK